VRRWWLVIILLLSLGANLGILATLAVNRISPVGQPEVLRPIAPGKLSLVADRLGLKGEAKKRFIERHRRFLNETAVPRKRLGEIRLAVRSELIAAHPDRARLDALMKEASAIFLDLERALADLVLEIRAALPPEAEGRYVDLLSRLKLEGPGAYGRLPPALWQWFNSGAPPPPGMPPEVLPREQMPGGGATAPPPH
jgi:hypothetical protein